MSNTFSEKQQRCRSLFLELNGLLKLYLEPSSKERNLINQLSAATSNLSGTTEFTANILTALGIGVTLSPVSGGLSVAAVPLTVAALMGLKELFKLLENKDTLLPRNSSEKESTALALEMLLNEVAYLIPISYQEVIEDHLTTEGVDEFASYAFSRVIKKLHQSLSDKAENIVDLNAYDILDYLRSSDRISIFGKSATVTTTDPKSAWSFSNQHYAKRAFSRPKIAVLQEKILPDGTISLEYDFYEAPSQPEPKSKQANTASSYGYTTISQEELNLLYSGREQIRRKLPIPNPTIKSKLRSLYTVSPQQLSDYAEKKDYAFIKMSTDPRNLPVDELQELANQKLVYALFGSSLYYINEHSEIVEVSLKKSLDEEKARQELQALFPSDAGVSEPPRKSLEQITLLTGHRGQSLNAYLSQQLGFNVIAQYRGKLQNINFSYGDYRNVYFTETEYCNCNFENSDWSFSILNKSQYDAKCNYHCAIYQHANFYRSQFNGLTLQGDFSHAWMCAVTINDCRKGNMIEIGTDWRLIGDADWQTNTISNLTEADLEQEQKFLMLEMQRLAVVVNSRASRSDLDQVLEKSIDLGNKVSRLEEKLNEYAVEHQALPCMSQTMAREHARVQDLIDQLKKDNELLLATLLTWRNEMDDFRKSDFSLVKKNMSLTKKVDTLSDEIRDMKLMMSNLLARTEKGAINFQDLEGIRQNRELIDVESEKRLEVSPVK